MKTSFWPVCTLILATSWSWLAAQQNTLAFGPVAGYVFDSSGTKSCAPIQGVPGASLLGDPVNFGFNLAAAYVSPGQDSAFFVVGADHVPALFSA